MSEPITITVPMIVKKGFELFWSEDSVIELYDDFLIAKDNFISEVYIDEDDKKLGKKESLTEYETCIRKDKICEVEWVYDNKNEYYLFQINLPESGIGWPTKNKKIAIDNYNILKKWLFK